MGFDGIPAEAIKNDLTCRFLGKLFNLCYLKHVHQKNGMIVPNTCLLYTSDAADE